MTSGMGQRICIMRKLNNINIEDLSESVGLSASYIDLIECRDRSPSLETLITICTELNASLDFVVNGYGAKAQIKISPVVFCTGDEDENDFGFGAEWDEITKKVNLEQSVSETIISKA